MYWDEYGVVVNVYIEYAYVLDTNVIYMENEWDLNDMTIYENNEEYDIVCINM